MRRRRDYKWLFVLGFLLAAVGQAYASEFSAETSVERFGKMQKVKMYFKGRSMRQEMRNVFGEKQILITRDHGKDHTFVLYPKNRSYMSLPAVAVLSPVGNDAEALGKIGTRRFVGEETLNGYLCDKYEITFHNRYRGKMLQWVARKLERTIRLTQTNGPPTRAFTWELTNIREEKIPDSLFELPPDFKEVKKPIQGFCGAGVCKLSFY